MRFDRSNLPDEVLAFMTERHLATLTLVRSDGTPHVTPVGFSWDDETGTARVITWAGSMKTRLLEPGGGRAALCQVDGGRWLTLEGSAVVTGDPGRCADAVARYAERYRPPRQDRGADRRAIEVTVDRIMGLA
ncbi:MAG: pyridoxamine 5'-phosphate oxidase family protein [Acidimicrobiia bacterium]|nr:pyridoxamine 5'-phosphate oxidase family protein [Acidimicrobiia bacterium]